MRIKLTATLLTVLGSSACSMLPFETNEGETLFVEEEEITIAKIYRSQERLHCQKDSGKSLEDTEAELESENIKVYSSECGVITGKMAPSMCGETTLHINIHGIDEGKLEDATSLDYSLLTSIAEELSYETENCDDD